MAVSLYLWHVPWCWERPGGASLGSVQCQQPRLTEAENIERRQGVDTVDTVETVDTGTWGTGDSLPCRCCELLTVLCVTPDNL